MKSMLSGVAFKLPSPEIGDLFGDPVIYVQKLRIHGENLTKALEAALRLCEAYRLEHDEAVRNYWQEKRTKELETALEPFKVAGDDAKTAPK